MNKQMPAARGMPSQSYSMNGYNGTVRASAGTKQLGGSAFVSGQQGKFSYSVNAMTSYNKPVTPLPNWSRFRTTASLRS